MDIFIDIKLMCNLAQKFKKQFKTDFDDEFSVNIIYIICVIMWKLIQSVVPEVSEVQVKPEANRLN